ncbi:TerB family tellurite resistance protein [Planctobacterium marinum]|uniref:Co-chaperone DjlA N-terminal domain-containing protein n=1 Tax=Planctobacterium marinum TaxID=1631968 RepID=A0AA48HQR3_9ALTE|nr:hypothetical protein MACH26_17750 [Planctobacterium marinum]
MFKALFDWLDLDSGASSEQASEILTVPLATAVLYYEVLRADEHFSADELELYEQKVFDEFDLTQEQLRPFLKKVEAKARHAVDYMQFTRLIHENCSIEQKRNIVISLWHLAMSDGNVDAHEEHLIRKMSDLMYLSHSDFIQTRILARDSLTTGK